jgi:hypothetical protein
MEEIAAARQLTESEPACGLLRPDVAAIQAPQVTLSARLDDTTLGRAGNRASRHRPYPQPAQMSREPKSDPARDQSR